MSSGTRVRQSHILKALKERHGGRLSSTTDCDAAVKLLTSMGFARNKLGRLHEHLEKMHEGGTLVVSWADEVVTGISLPELATSTETDTERTDMVAPRGQKGTVQPRTSDDKSIGSTLSRRQVSPVEVGYTSPEAEAIAKDAAQDVVAAGEMVLEELLKATNETMTHQELAQFTLSILNGVFTGIALQGLTQPVVGWLVTNGHLKKIPGKESTYRLVRRQTEAEPDDVNKSVIQLLDDLEERDKIEAELREENTSLRQQLEQRISPEKLNELLDDIEKARASEQRLNNELRELKIQRNQQDKAHGEEIRQLRKQLATANSANQDLQEQLKTKPSGLDETTKARMRALGYSV